MNVHTVWQLVTQAEYELLLLKFARGHTRAMGEAQGGNVSMSMEYDLNVWQSGDRVVLDKHTPAIGLRGKLQ